MSPRQVIIIGAGRRVRETALPAFAACEEFEVRNLVARSARTLEVDGKSHDVQPLADLTQSDLTGVDLIYMVVSKDAVPAVLAQLTALDVSAVDLLIETPVVRFRHFRHSARLDAFRNTWVSEDCCELPWIGTMHAAIRADLIGDFRSVRFDQSAYAYHGVAMAKTILGAERISSARRHALDGGRHQRDMHFAGGLRARMIEPRDYTVGHVSLQGSTGSIADFGCDERNALQLIPVVEDERVRGFRIGDIKTVLDDAEVSLTGGSSSSPRVSAHMDAMKRVGYLRLLRRIANGRGAYPLVHGLDDMVVDYHLEKLGRYMANPLTSVRSPFAHLVLGTLSRLGG